MAYATEYKVYELDEEGDETWWWIAKSADDAKQEFLAQQRRDLGTEFKLREEDIHVKEMLPEQLIGITDYDKHYGQMERKPACEWCEINGPGMLATTAGM